MEPAAGRSRRVPLRLVVAVACLFALTFVADGRAQPSPVKRKYRDFHEILSALPENVRPAPGHKWDDVNFKLANRWLKENVDGIDFEVLGTVKEKKTHKKDDGVTVELSMHPFDYEVAEVHPECTAAFDARQSDKVAKLEEKAEVHVHGTLRVSIWGRGGKEKEKQQWDLKASLDHAELK